MKIDSAKIEALRELLAAPHRKIVLVAHTNPDGDAIGASTAWRDVLAAMGHEVTMIVPNKYPYFLDWMPDIREVVIFRFAPERALEAIRGADIVFCLDFNSLSRLEALSDALAENTAARRVLIITFRPTEASTCNSPIRSRRAPASCSTASSSSSAERRSSPARWPKRSMWA